MSAEFGPLRVRRYRAPEPMSQLPPQASMPEVPPQTHLPESEHAAPAIAAEGPSSSSPPTITAGSAASGEPAGGTSVFRDAPSYDEERFAAAVREEAIRFASIAAARALRVALVDAATIAKYVDDALRACGRAARATVRLHPRDALTYRPARDIDVVSDDSCEEGQVVIELPAGSLGATVDERAALLVRAAAC